ncbi:hypothetical protein FB565_008610 [Actinoplanes lutulentus]|uniref:DUF6461 domain-containing protein n=1 Tax=Actinoplanes lutulentus TaxID=1287878 RepID=UPI0016063839|nr:DUF6461 domain-containing protein [Actinoplanes lutulentus]MBB2948824.1 hypothetical protein [Actinoplanes lutulentus]
MSSVVSIHNRPTQARDHWRGWIGRFYTVGERLGQGGSVAPAAEDYSWLVETQTLGFSFNLALVRGLAPDDVIAQLGGPDPVDIIGTALLEPAAGLAISLPDPDTFDATVTTGLTFVAAARVGSWTLIVEPLGSLCAIPAVARMLSTSGEMVCFDYHEHGTSRFSWSRDGDMLVVLEPESPALREGSSPDQLNDTLTQLGFTVERSDDVPYDRLYGQRTLALMECLTGVRITPELLDSTAYRCAAVPGPSGWGSGALDPSAAGSFLIELRELLADYADDPADHNNPDRFAWFEMGVTDKRVRATGHYGLQLFTADPAFLRAVAHASPELHHRLIRWLRDQPFAEAGILNEPWFAPVRNALHRGAPIPKAELRKAEQHLDSSSPDDRREGPGRRAFRSLRFQPGRSIDPGAMTCILMSQLAGFRSTGIAEIVPAVRQAFPELADVEIPEQPPERDRARRWRETREHVREQQRNGT